MKDMLADLLRPVFAHELQQQERLVHVTPVFLCVLQPSGKYTHDLLVVVDVIRGFGNFCRTTGHVRAKEQVLVSLG